MSALRNRIGGKWRRVLVDKFACRTYPLPSNRAYISFTFDDFPKSAFSQGGEILRSYDVHGSYYVAMRLLGQPSPSGTIASVDDLRAVVADGHEIGCHTFGHLNGASADVDEFIQSIAANQQAFQEVVPDGRLKTFAYPFDGPRLGVKRAMKGHFLCCRGGGQTFNRGTADLALVKSYFIDHRAGNSVDGIRELIERCVAASGWLVFSTHDVADEPSPFGCRPGLFEEIVRLARQSAARVLTVGDVCKDLGVVVGARRPEN